MSRGWLRTGSGSILLWLLLALPIIGDYLELSNGDRISGTILSLNSKQVRLKTSYGTIEIPREEILWGEFGTPGTTGETKTTEKQIDVLHETGLVMDKTVPREGLVCELLFNAQFLDSSGNKHSIKAVNNPFFIEGINADSNNAVLSDGTGTYLELANTPDLRALNSFTLSLWVLIQVESGNQYLAAKWEKASGQTADGKFALSYSNGFLYFYIVDEQGFYHGQKTPLEIKYKKWHHLAALFDQGTMQLYLDGQLLAEQTVPAKTLFQENSPLYLMTAKSFTQDGWAYYNLVGRLDNVRLYDRALQAEEITVLFEERSTGQ